MNTTWTWKFNVEIQRASKRHRIPIAIVRRRFCALAIVWALSAAGAEVSPIQIEHKEQAVFGGGSTRNVMLVAKVIGTETSRVYSEIAKASATSAVDQLAAQLAEKILSTVTTKADTLVANHKLTKVPWLPLFNVKRIATFLLFPTLLFFASSVAGANTRLAIGTLGLIPENRNATLGDIIASQLSTASGFDLVERRELNAVLKEASLGLGGVVRAKDAVRVGALLRADQFLLGSSISVNGTNRLIIRLVDSSTGMIRSIGVFRDNAALEVLAAEIAEFAREEIKHPLPEHRDFLALGVIQNLGINNRFSDFPAQLRGSVAATLSSKV